MPVDHRNIVLALFQGTGQQAPRSFTRTGLVKYLYLLDVYCAEETSGQTCTGWSWRFVHYGPFSTQAVALIDSLVEVGALKAEERERASGDSDFTIYSLAEERGRLKGLKQLGIPGGVVLRLESDIKRFTYSLSKLLDYVYFRTAPMMHAEPGDSLDFSVCRRRSIDEFRTIEMRKLRPKSVRQVREKLRNLIQRRAETTLKITDGPYDDAYSKGLQCLEGEPLAVGAKGTARIRSK